MQRWEIMRHWVPVDLKVSHSAALAGATYDYNPSWGEGFKKAWAEAELLAHEGWELVSVAPETAARLLVSESESDSPGSGVSFSYTLGHMLLFRRPKV